MQFTLCYLVADTPPWGDGDANFLSSLVQLEILDLARTYVGSPHLEVLGKLTNLRQLDLCHTAMQGPTLQTVSPALTGLERLDVSYTPVVRLMQCCCSAFLSLAGSVVKSGVAQVRTPLNNF